MARMGNNAAAIAFAAEQEKADQQRLAEAAQRNQAIADAKASGNDSLAEALTLFPTLSPAEAEAWNQQRMSISADGSGRSFGGLFSPVENTFNAMAKLPGTPEAAAKGLEAGISGDASWNPYDKNGASVFDIGAGGTELSQNEKARDIGRTIGTIVGGGFATGAFGGEAAGLGAGEAAATGGGDLMGLGGTYAGPGFEFGGELANAGIGIGGSGSGATFGGSLGGLEGAMAGLGGADYLTPPGEFMGPSEYGPPGTPDAPVDLPPGTPPASQTIPVNGTVPPGGLPPIPPIVPPTTITEPPGPTTITEPPPKTTPNYGKLLSSLLGNLLSTGGSGSGGSGYGSGGLGAQDKLARSLRQPSEPVTTTNPNYIPR